MKLGKRRRDAAAPDRPDTQVSSTPPPRELLDRWTVPAERPVAYEQPVADEQPVYEGEAVELPIEHVAAQAYEPPVPLTMEQPPVPVAEEPVAVVTPGGEPAPVSSLGAAGEAYASGHAVAPGPSWQESVMELAKERPELVVGAAFAGGFLAALILRRLGN